MAQAKDFRILSLQLTIYTPELLFNPNKILGNLMSKFSDIFDGNTTVLPVPRDVPKDVPRLILVSSDERIRLDISEARANFVRYRDESDTLIDKDAFWKLCSDVYKEYMESTSARVNRIAFVSVKFLNDGSPGLTLAQSFCKDNLLEEPFNRPENFEIHSHKIYTFEDFKVNSWVRCKSGVLKANKAPIILVEQDINTISDKTENYEFSLDDITKFVNLVDAEQGIILTKYFPEQ